MVGQNSELLVAERALQAGARGIILKEQDAGELLTAIDTVLRGEIWLNS